MQPDVSGHNTVSGIISGSREILDELHASKDAGNILWIWAKSRAGITLIMCTVESIREDRAENDKAIIVKEISAKKTVLKSHLLYLRQIVKVHQYKHPLLRG